MRLLTCLLAGTLAALLGLGSAAAQDTSSDPPKAPPGPTTLELIEDLRILSILNVLQPTREQSSKLAAVAAVGKEGLAAIEAEVKAKLAHERERLIAAREKVLRGGVTPQLTDQLLGSTVQAAQATRAQKTEALIVNLAARARGILTREQAALIENELAPTTDQPWRRYARVLTGPGPAPAARAGARLPADPGKWLKELRDLRIDSAEGDPAYEIQDFGKKLTRGLPPGTPLFEASVNQARAFATQVLAMPPNVFAQRELELARMAAKQELDTRNQQRVLEGKPIETFDAYRWIVEEVLLSPRAATDLRDRAAAP
jgi:hypothetical protein